MFLLKKSSLKIGFFFIFLLFFSFIKSYADEIFSFQNKSTIGYKIVEVIYNIEGFTKQYPLSLAVPIDTKKVFESEAAFLDYIEEIKLDFNNLRTLQSSSIIHSYGEAEDGIIPVTLNISVKDTWNIIAIPYPRFDSNSGFRAKIKLKDFNFFGLLQTLNADFSYALDEKNKPSGEIGINFGIPFKAGIFDAIYQFDTALSITKRGVGFDLGNNIEFKYPLKYLDFNFGFYQGIYVNKHDDKKDDEITGKNNIGGKIEKPGEENKNKDSTDDFIGDKYYFSSKFYIYTPIKIYHFDYAGNLVWTPYVSVSGNWAFKKLMDKREILLTFSHSLGISRLNWINNFRQGFSVSLSNSYAYNFLVSKKPDIDFGLTVHGYYSFADRVGIYTQFDAFHILSGKTTERAGRNLRGILNRRIKTDTGITLSIDIPIKITVFDFEKITGISWTKYFGFEWHISPFIDMAWTRDIKTGRTFHPADGWYSGGVEMIIYPLKMRSIYARISAGYDLAELKNTLGRGKIRGRAARDGESVLEIFIGIGLHY